MTTLYRYRNWKIQVYGREHGIAHFHVRAPDGSAVISIDALEVLIDGDIGMAALEEAKTWARAHRAELIAEWMRLNPEKRYGQDYSSGSGPPQWPAHRLVE